MIEYKNLVVIGSSHVAIESVREVKRVIEDKKPSFVAIELDKGRFIGLMSKQKKKLQLKQVLDLGISGFLFNFVGAWVEERVGKMVRVKPGTEMKQAVISGAKVKAKLVLVDQDIRITIKKFMKTITWKEKFRFIGDIVKGIFGKSDLNLKGFDLRKVPKDEFIEKVIGLVSKRYPSVYKCLIHDRNKVMSKRLVKLMEKYPDDLIVAVVGAGHVKGMDEIIRKSI
jgi:pheromone shutdown-related protein TraB